MSKKEFDLDVYNQTKKKSNPKNKGNKKNKNNTSNMSKPSNKSKTIRATFILKSDTKKKIDEIAYYNRKEKSQQVEEILSNFIEKHYTEEVKEVWESSK